MVLLGLVNHLLLPKDKMSATSAEKLALKSEKSGKPPASHSENLKGALFMVIAMAGFTINDTFVKTVGETLNIGQTLFIRGCFAVIAIAIAAHLTGTTTRGRRRTPTSCRWSSSPLRLDSTKIGPD